VINQLVHWWSLHQSLKHLCLILPLAWKVVLSEKKKEKADLKHFLKEDNSPENPRGSYALVTRGLLLFPQHIHLNIKPTLKGVARVVLGYLWPSFNWYIEDITCPRVDMNFIFKWSTRYLTSEISSWTREDKIHIHKRACNILFII